MKASVSFPPLRPDALAQQVVESVRTAELVAMDQRAQHHMRAGRAAVERGHVVDTGLSPTTRDIERLQLDGI